jgi:hypothetical protein
MDKIFEQAFKTKSTEQKEKLAKASAPPEKSNKKSEVRKTKISKEAKKATTKGQKDSSGRQKTGDGYNLYKEDELDLGKGGDTPECPFDCACCF